MTTEAVNNADEVFEDILIRLPLDESYDEHLFSLAELNYKISPTYSYVLMDGPAGNIVCVRYETEAWQRMVVDSEEWDVLLYCDPLKFAVIVRKEQYR